MDDLPLPGLMPEPGSYDHVDPDRDRQVRAEASLREERLKEVEASIPSTPTGREWAWGLLNSMHVFEQRIAVTGSAYEEGFWSGERDVGIRLLRKFARGSPIHFAKMFAENDRQ